MTGLRGRFARTALPGGRGSGSWLFVGMGAENALRFARNMLLARLLAPEAFGQMAVVSAVALGFQTFTEIGIRQAVVQHERGETRDLQNAAFWVALARGSVLLALAFAAAPFIAKFFGQPELAAMLRVALAGLFCEALTSPAAYAALRAMDYRRWALSSHLGGALGVAAAMLLALVLPGAWALVAGFCLEGVSRCTLSYVLCPFRPGLDVDRAGLRDLLRFARGMFGLPVLMFIFMRTDVFVVGKLSTTAQLGVYSMCAALAQTAFLLVERLLDNLLLPRFSRLSSDRDALNRAIMGSTRVIVLAGMPMLLAAAFYGRWVLAVVYGWPYAAAATVLALMVATSLLRILSMPLAVALFSLGRPDLHRRFVAIRALAMALLILPAVSAFGLEGAAAAGLIAMATGFAFQCRTVAVATGLDLRRHLGLAGPGMLAAAPVALVALLARGALADDNLLHLAHAALGIAASAGMALWLGRRAARGCT